MVISVLATLIRHDARPFASVTPVQTVSDPPGPALKTTVWPAIG
jgi:hypothetical protein